MRRVAIFVIAIVVAGCQTVGGYYDKMFGGSSTAIKPAELQPLTPRADARIVWQVGVGAAGKFEFTPTVSAGAVYAANTAGEILKIDVATGKVEWRTNTEAKLSAGPGTDGRTIVVGTPRGEVIALDASGKTIWKALVSGEVLTAPVVDEGIVVVRSGDGRIFGLSVADGKRRWLYQRALPPLTVRAPAGLTGVPGGVISGFPGGKLVAVLLKNGGLVWEATVASPRGSTELERMADIVGSPLLDGRVVCAVAYQGRAGCFDALKGAQLWARDLSSLMPLAGDSRHVYATDDKDNVHALDKGSGASIWKQEKLTARGVTGAAAIAGFVAVGDYQGYVHFLDRTDGSFVARIATDGSPILRSPINAGDTVLVQTRNGGLFNIAIR